MFIVYVHTIVHNNTLTYAYVQSVCVRNVRMYVLCVSSNEINDSNGLTYQHAVLASYISKRK